MLYNKDKSLEYIHLNDVYECGHISDEYVKRRGVYNIRKNNLPIRHYCPTCNKYVNIIYITECENINNYLRFQKINRILQTWKC